MRNESRLNIYINNEQGRKALGELADQYQKTTAALETLTKAGKGNGEQADQLKQKQDELNEAATARKAAEYDRCTVPNCPYREPPRTPHTKNQNP